MDDKSVAAFEESARIRGIAEAPLIFRAAGFFDFPRHSGWEERREGERAAEDGAIVRHSRSTCDYLYSL